jgi:hypothetical protein
MEFLKASLVSVFAVVVLVACGGGGGGFSGGDPVTGAAVAITADNAEAVTGVVVGSVEAVEGLSEGGTAPLLGVAVQTNGAGFNYADFVLQRMDGFSLVRERVLNSGIAGVVIPAETIPCSDLFGPDASGSVTISGEVQDPNLDTISIGDSLLMSFNNCTDGFGTLLNGSFDFSIASLSGDPLLLTPPFSVTVAVEVNNFTVVEGGQTFGGDGDMQLTIAENSDATYELGVSGVSLSSSENGTVVTLSDYAYVITGNNVTFEYQLSIDGTLDSTEIGGSVTFETLETFVGIGEGNPNTGILRVTGANNSTCQLTAQPDAVNAEILVDADADGTFETTIMTTWSVLAL